MLCLCTAESAESPVLPNSCSGEGGGRRGGNPPSPPDRVALRMSQELRTDEKHTEQRRGKKGGEFPQERMHSRAGWEQTESKEEREGARVSRQHS